MRLYCLLITVVLIDALLAGCSDTKRAVREPDKNEPAATPSAAHEGREPDKVERGTTTPSMSITPQSIQDAARDGDLAVIKSYLAEDPSSIDSRDKIGFSPLHWASVKGNKQVVEFLLQHGADLADEKDDTSPLDLARTYGHRDVSSCLVSHKRRGLRPVDYTVFVSLDYTSLLERSVDSDGSLLKSILEPLTSNGFAVILDSRFLKAEIVRDGHRVKEYLEACVAQLSFLPTSVSRLEFEPWGTLQKNESVAIGDAGEYSQYVSMSFKVTWSSSADFSRGGSNAVRGSVLVPNVRLQCTEGTELLWEEAIFSRSPSHAASFTDVRNRAMAPIRQFLAAIKFGNLRTGILDSVVAEGTDGR